MPVLGVYLHPNFPARSLSVGRKWNLTISKQYKASLHENFVPQKAAGPWFWCWNRFQSWLQALKALWRMEGFRDGRFLLCSQLPPELTKMVSLIHLTKPAGTHLEGTPDTLLQTWNKTKDSLLIGWKPSDSCWKIKSYRNSWLFNGVSC